MLYAVCHTDRWQGCRARTCQLGCCAIVRGRHQHDCTYITPLCQGVLQSLLEHSWRDAVRYAMLVITLWLEPPGRAACTQKRFVVRASLTQGLTQQNWSDSMAPSRIVAGQESCKP